MMKSRKMAAVLLILALCLACASALADGWFCPTCGNPYPDSYLFCPKDGTAKPADLGGYADDNYTVYADVYATSIARVATRTGPGTQYDEPGSFHKAGTCYRVLSKGYDSRNGIWWVQIEISYQGGTIWAYTGAEKRFGNNLNLNAIPEEKIIGRCRTSSSLTGAYAPTADGLTIKRKVPAGVECAIYGYYYRPAGDMILVEFYDSGLNCYRRAWIQDAFVDDYEMYYGF